MAGVKGMHWGVRRSSSELRSAAAARGDTKPKTDVKSAGAKKPPGDIQDKVEGSAERYARLAGQAKAGQAGVMSDQDLKFFNARTEALSKINKLNEDKPSWLKETTTKVIQQSAQRQMQGLADAVADKYIGDPLKNAIKGGAEAAVAVKASATGVSTPKVSIADRAKAAALNATAKKPDATPDVKSETAKVPGVAKNVASLPASVQKTSVPANTDPSKMQFSEALKYYADNPSVPATAPQGYSPNANKIFLDELARLRGQ